MSFFYPECGGVKFVRKVGTCLPNGRDHNLSDMRALSGLLVLVLMKQAIVVAEVNHEDSGRVFFFNPGDTTHMHVDVML